MSAPDLTLVVAVPPDEALVLAATIDATIAGLSARIAERGLTWELVLAVDITAGPRSLPDAVHLPNVQVVRVATARDRLAAVRGGFDNARGRTVLLIDPTRAIVVAEIDRVLHRMEYGADIAVRWPSGSVEPGVAESMVSEPIAVRWPSGSVEPGADIVLRWPSGSAESGVAESMVSEPIAVRCPSGSVEPGADIVLRWPSGSADPGVDVAARRASEPVESGAAGLPTALGCRRAVARALAGASVVYGGSSVAHLVEVARLWGLQVDELAPVRHLDVSRAEPAGRAALPAPALVQGMDATPVPSPARARR